MRPVTTQVGLAKRALAMFGHCDTGAHPDGVVADDHRAAVVRQREYWERQAAIIEAGGVAS